MGGMLQAAYARLALELNYNASLNRFGKPPISRRLDLFIILK
jgi:hypothetical protein